MDRGFFVEMAAIIFGSMFVVTLICVGVFIPVNFLLVAPSCHERGAAMGLKTEYGFYKGCLVYVDGQLIPLTAYETRVIEQNIRIK